jgi:hypothetical protein
MFPKHRSVKSDVDIVISEVTRPGSKAYSVGSKTDPTSERTFGDMGAAEAYFRELVLRRVSSGLRPSKRLRAKREARAG